ncbi:MAG TPA: mandelate racemase/muconate lactonizing enzyme family protein [Solirubrobacteraceae bacterium]|nr:mandelate racemase/muconate lactonizing enzyme family protein [Solirubrobacteraceae bacterium]
MTVTSTPRVPAPSTMPIVEIETIPIRVPLRRVYQGSHYQMTHRSTLIVRVVVDGLVGEAYAGDEDSTLLEIERIVTEEIAPKLIGEDAFAVERCWELSRPVTYDILRDRRLGLVASAAVDAAIWDLIGKAVGQPLWRLWGGYRSSLPMIAIGGYYAPDADIAAEVAELREMGLAGMKFKVGGLTPAEDAERFRQAREAGGPDFLIAADANQGWTPGEAIEFARLVAGLDLLWLEEPCRWHNDHLAMRDVRYQAGVRVCAGQSEFSAGGCRDLMVAGAIDVCNFDASWSGGPTEWRRVAAMAHTFDVTMTHHEEPQVSSHLIASIPHGGYVECFHPDRDPIWWGLIANRPPLRDGILELSERPGLGWELDEDYIDRYRVRA